MAFNKEKANFIHNNFYDYSGVIYKNIDTKVEILCPLHGKFLQTPYKHINSKQGCPKCRNSKISKSQSMGLENFVKYAKTIHNEKYDYSNSLYVNSHTKLEIKCPKHGSFLQTPTNHIHNKNGCPRCGSNVSMSGANWILSFDNKNIITEFTLCINGSKYKVDGFDPTTNTIYEYFGKFWHGCPTYTDHTKINPKNGIPFKTLYKNTLHRIQIFESNGFNIIYKWGE